MNRFLLLLSFLSVLMYACNNKISITETPANAVFESESESESESEEMKINYPVTKKGNQIDVYHNIEVADPYRWLEDDLSEETAEWVAAQNKVTFGYLDKIPFRKQLKNRIKTLLDYEKVSAPFKEGKYEYFFKNDGLQDHSVCYRSKIGTEDEPEVFLDPNTFSDDGTVALVSTYFTKDGSLMGYTITEGGSDWRKVITMDTETKEIVEDTLVRVKFSGISWLNNEGFYYSTYDKVDGSSDLSAKNDQHKVYYHKIGTPQSEDQLIYGGKGEENRYVWCRITEDQQYLVVNAAQNTSGSQIYVKPVNSQEPFILLEDDYFSETFYIENEGDRFYFITNVDAPNKRIVSVDIKKPGKENWVDVIPETDQVLRARTGGGYIFANYLVDAKTAVKQYDMKGDLVRDIELPGIGSAGGFGGKKEDKDFYYRFSSFLFPNTIYKYSIDSGQSELYVQPDIDFNPDIYETNQVFYASKDGTKIPMFITHKKGLELNGNNPAYLYGYGGFDVSLTPSFSASRLAWLEQGGIYVEANLRGGGEYGEKWHKAGTQLNKQNVFDDFIAAAEWLIAEGYTSSEKLVLSGRSNGGLLVGATMCQRPALAKVALPEVGVLDMLRYHTFTAGAGWAADYGTAEDNVEMFNYLKKYSPLHALQKETAYPATMVITADHDDRVVPAHSFKFAATLQEMHVGANPVLIRIQTNAGHGAVSLTQRIDRIADIYAFCWENIGFVPKFEE